MPFKWLKRRRNTLAADSPRPNLSDAPPLPSPTATTRPSRRMSFAPSSASPSTPATEAPKIRRRKSFFQTLGLSKDKGRERERKRASSFGASPAPRFDKDVPPVPPLPNGTPISSQFQTPPSNLEPAGRQGKRISLIPRKAPPSAWAGAESPTGSAPPVPPLPVPVANRRQTMPAPKALPSAPGVSAVQLDDLPDSADFSALDALDRLDAIGNLDMDLAQQNGAPSAYGDVPRVSKRSSLPAFNKPLPSPSLAPPSASKASKHMSLDPRARPPVISVPEVDRVPIISPSAAKLNLGDELPPPPAPTKEATPGGRKPVHQVDPDAVPAPRASETSPSQAPSLPVAASISLDPPTIDFSAPPSTESAYRLSPPASVEMVPLPDILNRPSAGYEGPRVDATNAISASAASHAESKSELPYDQEPKPKAKTPQGADGKEPEPPFAGGRGVMGGPAKIQAVFDSALANQPGETESESASAERAPAAESLEDAPAEEPEEPEQTPAQRYGIMGGPAKIEAVWESSQAARDARGADESTKADESKDAEEGKDDDKGEEDKDASGDKETKEGQDKQEGKEVDATEHAAETGETEEMADDSASVTSDASAQPITTERLEHIRRPSSNWGASTEQLVDRPVSGMTDFGPRPPSGMTDLGRPNSTYTDFSSPPRPSAMDSNPHLLGTPSRRGIPSTQTFGSLPGTTTFGNLPRPTSLIEEPANSALNGSPLATLSEAHSDSTDATVTLKLDEVAPSTPPRRVQSKEESGDVDVPDLYTPGTTPPSQNIHTPASHTRQPATPSPSTPAGVPFKATRSVSTPYKSPHPQTPNKRSVSGGPPMLPSIGTNDEPTLDDFMTIFRQVQKRDKGTGIGAAAAAAEGREYRQPKLGIMEAQEASG